jgi:predicted DNA-binding transcriptional regulator AlpA
MVNIVTATELAKVLGKTEKTIHSDMVRRPASLPKWFKLPGGKKPLWLQETIDEFLLNQARRADALPRNMQEKR